MHAMLPQERAGEVERFVARLAGATIGATFNQYRETGGDDRSPSAPAIRRANLTRHLTERVAAPVVLVAEAAGWRGARYSGLCLLCERQLDGATPPGASPYRRSSRHPLGWSEPSATIVQATLALGGWTEDVLLFNVVPTHPAGAVPHSNRTPTRAEVAAGRQILGDLLDMVRPRHVAALGRVAAAALGDVPAVRHPANGGARRFREGLTALLSSWL